MATFNLYRQAQLSAWLAGVNWNADQVVATLHSAAYTPNLDTHRFVSDLTSELPPGGGYTVGGQLLAGRAAAYLPAGAWPTTWAPVTSYAAGQIIRPPLSPSMLFRCYAAGVSGSVSPNWPVTAGAVVADGSAAWAAIGAGAVTLTASMLQWASFTASFRYIIVSDRTPGLATAQPLIALADMGGSVAGSGGNLDVIFDSGSGSGIVFPLWVQ
jgi:hypothetical protein